MKNIKVVTFLLLFLLFFYSCRNSQNRRSEDLELLKSWMTGAFSSEEQSTIDTNFYNIHLYMSEIWTESNDGNWLYVEQAASWSLDKPYR